MTAVKQSESDLFIIDATALCYRAFFALPRLVNSKGMPTGAIYGFISIFSKFIKEQNPEYLAVCFDVSRDTFRQKKFSEYKIQRPKMPDELSLQMDMIKKVISNFNVPIFELKGYEADDLIATISKKAKESGFKVKIFTADKDLLQLISKDVNIIIPHKDGNILYDENKVEEKFGVTPSLVPEIIALMGDAADNIPGVKGIGEKTAQALIKEFKTVDSLLKNIKKVQPQRIADLINQDIEILRLSRELVNLEDELDLDIDFNDLKLREPNYKELFNIYKDLEFKSLLKELPIENNDTDYFKNVVIAEDKKDLEKIKTFIFTFKMDDDSGKYSFYVYIDENKIFKTSRLSDLELILEDNNIEKASFDIKNILLLLDRVNQKISLPYFDIMIAAYLADSSKTDFSLAAISYDYLGLNISNIDAPKELILIAKLKPILESRLKENKLNSLFYDIEMRLINVLAKMQINGIALDLKVINALSKDIEEKITGLKEVIFKESVQEFNLNSPKQLAMILFERLKLPILKRGKTGPSTNEAVLKQLGKDHKIAKLILEYRHLIKLKTGYIDPLPGLVDKKTNRIHAFFNQIGTETGRLSVNDPNLQNIPIKTEIGSQLRRAFIVQNNKDSMISADYSQIELRVLAHMSNDAALLEAFKNDEDVHVLTASFIYNIDKKEVDDKMRNVAKRINFAIIYGMSAYGLAQDLDIELEAAQSFIDAYFLRYKGVREFITSQIKEAQNNGFVTTIFGRKRFIRDINSQNKTLREFSERQAINSPIQGSSADLIKLAMINIDDELTKRELNTKMILQIHDELLFEVKSSELELVKSIVKNKMENVYKLNVPIKVDVKVGKNWLDA